MKHLLLLIGLSMIAFQHQAQKLTIDNIRKVSMRGSGAIKDGSDVKGYYFFYVSDKVDKKTNEYTIDIHDDNLQKLKSIKFEESKDVFMLECAFNGSDLAFMIYNKKEKYFEFQIYDATGKKKFSYTKDITNKEKKYIEAQYLALTDEDQSFSGMFPIENKGFLVNIPSRENKDYTFEIQYMSTEKRKMWSYIQTDGGKKFLGDYLGTANGVVYLFVQRYKSMMDQNPESHILGLSLESGKVLFEKTTDLPDAKFYPSTLSQLENGKMYLYGEYFGPNENIMKGKSNGFSFWEVNEKGDKISEKQLSWTEGLGKHLSVNSKGRINDFGYMVLHDIIQTSDGSIYAVTEGFKKVADGVGIAMNMLAGGKAANVMKIRTTDMLLIKFDPSFNIQEATIYPKTSSNVHLPNGADLASITLIGKFMKYYWGGFDYQYKLVSNDKSSFTLCYSDYVRGKDYKGGTFNTITYNNGTMTTDKINTKSDASWSSVLPAKQGQVLILEYFRKKKTMEVRFEKMN
ncbi:MAG: hypothetical protein KF880_04170 [Ferruginibacter sp.]|nr:hypothetical protein [Ferruginibacter sp.]